MWFELASIWCFQTIAIGCEWFRPVNAISRLQFQFNKPLSCRMQHILNVLLMYRNRNTWYNQMCTGTIVLRNLFYVPHSTILQHLPINRIRFLKWAFPFKLKGSSVQNITRRHLCFPSRKRSHSNIWSTISGLLAYTYCNNSHKYPQWYSSFHMIICHFNVKCTFLFQ